MVLEGMLILKNSRKSYNTPSLFSDSTRLDTNLDNLVRFRKPTLYTPSQHLASPSPPPTYHFVRPAIRIKPRYTQFRSPCRRVYSSRNRQIQINSIRSIRYEIFNVYVALSPPTHLLRVRLV